MQYSINPSCFSLKSESILSGRKQGEEGREGEGRGSRGGEGRGGELASLLFPTNGLEAYIEQHCCVNQFHSICDS